MLNILHPRRPSTASSQTSSSSFFHRRSPSPEPESFRHHHHHQQSQARYSRSASTCSTRSCENMGDDSRRQLWRAMLLLQQEYGCYHSARIDLALSSGEDGLSLMREHCLFFFKQSNLYSPYTCVRGMLKYEIETNARYSEWLHY